MPLCIMQSCLCKIFLSGVNLYAATMQLGNIQCRSCNKVLSKFPVEFAFSKPHRECHPQQMMYAMRRNMDKVVQGCTTQAMGV